MYLMYESSKTIQKLTLNAQAIAAMLNKFTEGQFPVDCTIMDTEFNAGTRDITFTILYEELDEVDLTKPAPKRKSVAVPVDPPKPIIPLDFNDEY